MATIVYESPDGGKTVYARRSGTVERTLHWQDSELRDTLDSIKEDKLWGEIRRMAETDQGIADLLDRARVYYQLKKNTP